MINKLHLLFILLFFPVFISAQNVDEEFSEALNLYNAENYYEALDLFRKIAEEYDLNSKTTVSNFFIAKIYLKQDRLYQARQTLTNFLEIYPGSRYSDEIRLLLIKTYLEQSDFNDAFENTVDLLVNTNNQQYKNEAEEIAERISLNYLKPGQIKSVSDLVADDELRSFLLLLLGKSYLKQGEVESAKEVFIEIKNKYYTSKEYIEADKLLNNADKIAISSGDHSFIGVLLPLSDYSGKKNTAVEEILDGIKFAVNEFNKDREDKIGIIIKDSQNSKFVIGTVSNEFEDNDQVKGILGPIFSEEVKVAIKEFEGSELVLISPTATDADLVMLSEYFYQANPSFMVRGKIVAQYLYYVENKRNIAVLNAIEGYSPTLALGFIQEFERLGGNVVVKETYQSNSYSLESQIASIAANALTIEGIYIPLADKIDAPAILSQMQMKNLSLPIYGNQDWFLVKGFETATNLSNQLTFSSDYYIDFNNPDFNSFNNLFNTYTGYDVNRNVLYGYDTAKFLLTVMRNVDPTRANIKRQIESGVITNGYHNNISFDDNRVNRFLNFVRYRDGKFELVDKFRAAY